ncbi:hypothetical protein ACSAZL_21280 [Methanosarcina sp. T3]
MKTKNKIKRKNIRTQGQKTGVGFNLTERLLFSIVKEDFSGEDML